MTATIFEAKARFSELVKRAQSGEEVIITSGREKTPVIEFKAVSPKEPKRLGARETPGFVLGPGFYEPLPPGWSGEDGDEDISSGH